MVRAAALLLMLTLVCSGGVRAQNRVQGVLPSALTAQDRTGTIWGAGEGGTIFRWTEAGRDLVLAGADLMGD